MNGFLGMGLRILSAGMDYLLVCVISLGEVRAGRRLDVRKGSGVHDWFFRDSALGHLKLIALFQVGLAGDPVICLKILTPTISFPKQVALGSSGHITASRQ